MSQTEEAVIISGPRKGKIISLPENGLPHESEEELSDEEIEMLNAALDEVIAALDRLSNEMNLTIEAFREREEAVA